MRRLECPPPKSKTKQALLALTAVLCWFLSIQAGLSQGTLRMAEVDPSQLDRLELSLQSVVEENIRLAE